MTCEINIENEGRLQHLQLRRLLENDIPVIQSLCKEWFPIEWVYPESWLSFFIVSYEFHSYFLPLFSVIPCTGTWTSPPTLNSLLCPPYCRINWSVCSWSNSNHRVNAVEKTRVCCHVDFPKTPKSPTFWRWEWFESIVGWALPPICSTIWFIRWRSAPFRKNVGPSTYTCWPPIRWPFAFTRRPTFIVIAFFPSTITLTAIRKTAFRTYSTWTAATLRCVWSITCNHCSTSFWTKPDPFEICFVIWANGCYVGPTAFCALSRRPLTRTNNSKLNSFFVDFFFSLWPGWPPLKPFVCMILSRPFTHTHTCNYLPMLLI